MDDSDLILGILDTTHKIFLKSQESQELFETFVDGYIISWNLIILIISCSFRQGDTYILLEGF
jgi:hypothetical protein